MAILLDDGLAYNIVDREFYEPLERYRPNESDFIAPVRRWLGEGWTLRCKGIWCHCQPVDSAIPRQGWKIHLSATLGNSPVVLRSATSVLRRLQVPFKFAVDRQMLFFLNFKRWPRGNAGKFMTVYPEDTSQCEKLLRDLHACTIGYRGPYILSDRRYKDSQVVHYRYGGIQPMRISNVRGEQTAVIAAADGALIEDQRGAFFHLPDGITDPFAAGEDPAAEMQQSADDYRLKDGRYSVDQAISFSNTGGVYLATDRESGDKVVIKEARPLTNVSPRGTDAVWLLKKEHRLLSQLDGTGVAPRAIDFFGEWEHFYLVEEYVEGIVLRGYNALGSLALRARPTKAHAEAYYEAYCRVYALVADALRRACTVGEPHIGTAEADEADEALLLERILAYIRSSMTIERRDRLFPAAPTLFQTNPLSVAYGACGVAHTFKRVTGDVPQEVIDWILQQATDLQEYPPGLYVGLSGIAWTLLELGLRDRAERLARYTARHPALEDSPDLFYGAAGCGMTQLKFFLETQDEEYLAAATRAGEFLLDSRVSSGSESWWPVEGAEHCGLAHGASGVSLFLLYLYLATGKPAFRAAGEAGLEYVLRRGIRNRDGGLTWLAEEGYPTHTPYWRWGSSGIGMVLLRYWRALGTERHKEVMQEMLIDAERKYSIFPGRFLGLAGIGEFFLDLTELGDEPASARTAARKALSGLLLFQIPRPEGTAFPGESRSRISCDLGTGSAGIALFLKRLHTGGAASFMLDELLVEGRRPLPESEPVVTTAAPGSIR